MTDLIIIGQGGHSKVVTDIANLNDYRILGYLDDNEPTGINREFYLGKVDTLPNWAKGDVSFIIAIGNNQVRQSIAERHVSLKIKYAKLIHPFAFIGSKVEILDGTVVMPGVIINAGTKIGRHVIVNTSAVIDHDCIVGDFAHIAQGAVLAGRVSVGCLSYIEVGARLRAQSFVGANGIIDNE